MPCHAVRTTTQTLENIPDPELLGAGLTEMGFKVNVADNWLKFNGVDKTTGLWQSGSYANGKLTTQEGLDLAMLKKYVAVANVKAQVEANNQDKYKKTKLTLTKVSEFNYTVTKS